MAGRLHHSELHLRCVMWMCVVVAADGRRQLGHNQVLECDREILSRQSPNGTVSSPNFPNPYPSHTRCAYTFHGTGKDRVQIMFKDFNLHHPTPQGRAGSLQDTSTECLDTDVLTAEIEINGERVVLDEYCGDARPEKLMSNGPFMRLVFRSYQSGPVRGFRFLYRFLRNFGITGSGAPDPRYECGFVYNSSVTRFGEFYSPNYSGLYPRNTECHYFFYGTPWQRVRIQFTYFDVEGIYPCLAATESDYVEFSNFQTVDRKMPRHCGYHEPNIVISDGDFFRVTFKSNQVFDATGFTASYQFINNTDIYPVAPRRRAQSDDSANGANPKFTAFQSSASLLLLLLCEVAILLTCQDIGAISVLAALSISTWRCANIIITAAISYGVCTRIIARVSSSVMLMPNRATDSPAHSITVQRDISQTSQMPLLRLPELHHLQQQHHCTEHSSLRT